MANKALPTSSLNGKIEIPMVGKTKKKPAIVVAGLITYIPYWQIEAYFFINGLAQIDA